jgi:hypothetical protein
MNEIEEKAIKYLKENKKEFLNKYLDGFETQDIKTAIFTAGASGIGKTEYSISRKEKEPFILDSNFAEASIAQSNIQRLLDKEYLIQINYIFRNIDKSYEFAKKRESITKRKVPLEVVKNSFKKMEINFLNYLKRR